MMDRSRALFVVNPIANGGKAGLRWEMLRHAFYRAIATAEDEPSRNHPRDRRPSTVSGSPPSPFPAATEITAPSRNLQADATIEKLTTHPGHARLIAQQTSNAYQHIIAVGGDGTFSEVASGILASPPPHPAMGIVPLGTGNDFARAVQIRNPAIALEALSHPNECKIDVIEVTCLDLKSREKTTHHALLFATIGITSALLEHTTRTVKRIFGERLAYLIGLLRALPSFQPVRLDIEIDGQKTSGRYMLLGASNAPTAGGGMRLAPGARLDDGLMNVNLIEAVSRFEILRHVHSLRRGTHIGHPRVRYCTAREITVNADPPATLQIDGDIVGTTPAHFRVLPAALALCVPSSSP